MLPNDPVSIFKTTRERVKTLEKMGIRTVADLLFHFPSRYEHISQRKSIASLSEGDTAVIYGKVVSTKTKKAYRSKIPIGEATIEDATGKIKAVWFHQASAAKMLRKGASVKLSGSVRVDKRGALYLPNPEFNREKDLPIDAGDSLFASDKKKSEWAIPVYPEKKGVTSRFLYHAVKKAVAAGVPEKIEDPLPPQILKKYHLPSLSAALVWIHFPRTSADAEAARKRFAFEEIFFIQLRRQMMRAAYRAHPAYAIQADKKHTDDFIARLGFPLTRAQKRAVSDIVSDIRKDTPMTRLLEGDVGSGKTAVAAIAAHAVVSGDPERRGEKSLGVAYMAPTEILAAQHFESFTGLFKGTNVSVGLLSGGGCKKFPSKTDPSLLTSVSRAQLLRWIEDGTVRIVIGTHALIQKSVSFKRLALVIIDEQHRFGTLQRGALVRKGEKVPHLLSMTATPIPRTLALTIHGDLDLTLIDEMPPGRKKVRTRIVLPDEREEAYDIVRKEIEKGRQAYVICPRIDEPDPEKARALRTRSVKAEAKRLQEKIFPEYRIGTLHGKMKPKEKEKTMEKFAAGETDILVSTSVVEVGVNVANATVILIEGAERFGLAALHQLRGRVARGTHEAHCLLFADTKTKEATERLHALVSAKNGFELAERDLALRGAGSLSGEKQWGVTDLGMEAIKNIKMVEAARKEAAAILAEDPSLSRHDTLKKEAELRAGDIHLE